MQFLKKHYEKVLLGIVLLGLTVGVGAFPFFLSAERAKLEASRITRLDTKVKPIDDQDMTLFNAALQRSKTDVVWNFTKDHNLVNPVLWQKMPPDSHLNKGEVKKQGPEVMEILSITPLSLRLGFNSVSSSGGYFIGFTNEAAVKAMPRTGERRAAKGEKNDLFTLRDVTGPPEKPTDLELELIDGGATVHLAPGKAFERVEDYEADLKYPPEPARNFRKKRRGDTLNLNGDDYKIVVITASNVVVSAKQNNKKTTITYKP